MRQLRIDGLGGSRGAGTHICKNHWKSSYDHTADVLKKEQKRLAREQQLKWLEEKTVKGKWEASIQAARAA